MGRHHKKQIRYKTLIRFQFQNKFSIIYLYRKFNVIHMNLGIEEGQSNSKSANQVN